MLQLECSARGNVSGWVCESQDNDSLFDDTDLSLSLSKAEFEVLNVECLRIFMSPVEIRFRDSEIDRCNVHEGCIFDLHEPS